MTIKTNIATILTVLTYILIALLVFHPFYIHNIWMFNTLNFIILLYAFVIIISVKTIFLNSYLINYLLFVEVAFLSLLWALKLSEGVVRLKDSVIDYMIFSIALTQYFAHFREKEMVQKRINGVIDCYLISMTILLIICYMAEGTKLLSWARLGAKIYSQNGTNTVLFTCYLLVAFYLAIYRIFNSRKKKWYFLLSLFIYISCILTGIRKTIVLPVVFLYVFLLIKNRKHFIKIIGITIITAVITYIGFLLIMRYSSSMAWRINKLLSQLNGSGQEASYITRLALRNIAYKAISEHPFLGIGIGQFPRYSLLNGGPFLYAHNNFLELLACVGIVGFIIYYSIYIGLLFASNKMNDVNKSLVIATVITSLFTDFYQVSYYYIPFAFLVTLCSSLRYCNKEKR